MLCTSLGIAPFAVGALCVLSLSGIATHSAYCSYLVSSSHPPPSKLRGFGVRAVSGAAMTQWVGDNWRLKAGPQPDPAPNNKMPEGPAAEIDPQLRHNGYKESFVQEYDGIKVYHHQGRYQHLGPQVYTWAFYEYRMVINSECWNIIVDENLKEVPSNFPGSSSAKLTHDFCHVDSDNSDDVYTNFSFLEMGGRTIWPFYTTETFQEDLWIWISPRRFAIISGHPHNEKLNHFYSNKMHEHHILANRAICWNFNEIETDAGKKKDRIIALSDDTRRCWASHETFITGFEYKYGVRQIGRKEEVPHGKRKYTDPAVQVSAKPPDATGPYSARDMQALNETFANPAGKAFLSPEQAKEVAVNTQWKCGQVPPLGSSQEGEGRKDSQLAYARTLLAVFNEAVSQLAVVVDNLEQLHAEKEAASSAGPPMAPANEQTQDKAQAAATGKQQQDAHQ